MSAWNGWYHVNGNTYGTWVPGDPRGWRERHHRYHVPGDYRKPPPKGHKTGLYRHSRKLLVQPPVHLSNQQCRIAGEAIVEKLTQLEIELLVVCLNEIHYHILGRFGRKQIRQQMGLAKLTAYHRLRRRWQVGKVWQRLCNVTPITSRAHQLRVFEYVRKHENGGAWVWTFRD